MLMVALRGRGGQSGAKDSWHPRLEIGEEDVSNTITSVQKDYLLMEIYEDNTIGRLQPEHSEGAGCDRIGDDNLGASGIEERMEDNRDI